MSLNRRDALLTAGSLFVAATSPVVHAQPAGTTRIIVAFPPGATSDFVARYIGQKLAERWNSPVIVDNRPGGDSQIGNLAAVRAKPDGLTLLMTSRNLASVNRITTPEILYDAEKDLAPVALVGTGPAVLVISSARKSGSISEFVQEARGLSEVTFSTSSTTGVMNANLLLREFKLQGRHIPYKGSAASVMAVASGEVIFTWDTLPAIKGLIDSGKLKALLVTAPQRLPQLPDVPTCDEIGAPALNAITGWWGLFAPAQVPSATVARINADVNAILALEETRKKFADSGILPQAATPEAFRKKMASEYRLFLDFSDQMKGK